MSGEFGALCRPALSRCNLKDPRWRWSLIVGLVLGLLATTYRLGSMALADSGYDLATWVFWLVMLGGPIVVGLRRLRAIFMS